MRTLHRRIAGASSRRPTLLLSLLTAAGIAAAAVGQDAAPDPRTDSLPANAIWLDSLGVKTIDQEWGQPHAGLSVDNQPLKLAGVTYAHGIGTHARSEYRIDLKGNAARFVADVGVDDEKANSPGSVGFFIWVDGKLIAESGTLKPGMVARRLSVDLTGAKRLTLIADDGGDGIDSDHADWAGAILVLAPGKSTADAGKLVSPVPVLAGGPKEAPLPIASAKENAGGSAPRIHGPRVVGTTPGRPFLFRIPATGRRPLTFTADNLPEGLALNSETGVITGSLKSAGTFPVTIHVTGPRRFLARRARDTRQLTIVGGDHQLALTPPMGWNSWNVWGTSVTADKVKAAADAMVSSGLADHGFSFVNIDDAWEGKRDGSGAIQTNEKFGDMKALADYVHGYGLKVGIYSSPGPRTCGGYEGSYQHEAQDAKTWAGWGIDYVKYDWCSYGKVAPTTGLKGVEMYAKPYQDMRVALDGADRDIIYSLCQYGMGQVWEWGAAPSWKVRANLWRTTGDIQDNWRSLSTIGFRQNGHEIFAAPGHWNDPDMMIVGQVGWGPRIRPTHLTPNEQITHVTLWSLLSSPLLLGCDLTKLDDFTLALLTNDEVLDVNQDPLGRPAGRIAPVQVRNASAGIVAPTPGEVWARPLFDGTKAVGLFNRGEEGTTISISWAELGLTGPQPVRNLWRRRGEGTFENGYSVRVPAHGAIFIKVGAPVK